MTYETPGPEDTAFPVLARPRSFTLAQDQRARGGIGPPPARREKSFMASRREARLGFTEQRRGDEILGQRPHVYFSLHPCQLSSVVLCSVLEKDNLTGWADLEGSLSWVSVQLPMRQWWPGERHGATLYHAELAPSGLRWLSELSPGLPTPLHILCAAKRPGQGDTGGTEIQPVLRAQSVQNKGCLLLVGLSTGVNL